MSYLPFWHEVMTQYFYFFTLWLPSIFSSASNMGSNFYTVHPSKPQQRYGFEFLHCSPQQAAPAFHLVHSTIVDLLCVKKVHFCNFVTISNNPSNNVSLHVTIEPLPSVTYPLFLIRTLKTIDKQIQNSPLLGNYLRPSDLNSFWLAIH